jgi:hypothetical protein
MKALDPSKRPIALPGPHSFISQETQNFRSHILTFPTTSKAGCDEDETQATLVELDLKYGSLVAKQETFHLIF